MSYYKVFDKENMYLMVEKVPSIFIHRTFTFNNSDLY